MARKFTKRDYLRTIDRLSKRVDRIFIEAFRRAVKNASVSEIESGIIAGDIDRILRALHIDAATFSQLTEEIRTAYMRGGISMQTTIQADFNVNDPATVRRLATQSADLVTGDLLDGQRQAIRQVLADNFSLGRNPRSSALDIVGRISKTTGRREGGIVGLAKNQVQYVTNARGELSTLDPRYFGRKLRDRRFDKMVQRAIDTKTPLTNAQVEKIAGRYSDRLLAQRGETIGRTETLRALNQGRDDAMNQAVESGKVKAENVTKQWQTAADSDVRDSHASMDMQRVPHGQPFVSGNRYHLMYPGDPFAPPSETVNCRCYVDYDVDYLAEGLG